MVFMVNRDCKCCQDRKIWHCEWCWNEYHNGRRDKDYLPEPPKELKKKLDSLSSFKAGVSLQPDKNERELAES